MAKRRRREGKGRRITFDVDERLGQAPQIVTAGVVTLSLAAQALPAELCRDECAGPFGGDPAVLPSNLDIDTVPTRANYVAVVQMPTASGGTIIG
jgi:hypothetical protein